MSLHPSLPKYPQYRPVNATDMVQRINDGITALESRTRVYPETYTSSSQVTSLLKSTYRDIVFTKPADILQWYWKSPWNLNKSLCRIMFGALTDDKYFEDWWREEVRERINISKKKLKNIPMKKGL